MLILVLGIDGEVRTDPGQLSWINIQGCERLHCNATANVDATVHAAIRATIPCKTRLCSICGVKCSNRKATETLDKPREMTKKRMLM